MLLVFLCSNITVCSVGWGIMEQKSGFLIGIIFVKLFLVVILGTVLKAFLNVKVFLFSMLQYFTFNLNIGENHAGNYFIFCVLKSIFLNCHRTKNSKTLFYFTINKAHLSF